jgi:hypothetical protein
VDLGGAEVAIRLCKVAAYLAMFLQVAATAGRADDRSASRPEGTGSLTGRVVDRQGQPVAGAQVWAVVFRERVGSTSTDSDGRFRLSALKEGRAVDVWGDAPGLARQRQEGVHVFAGRDRDIGPLILLPGTQIRGRVVDIQGRPIAGARIKIDDYHHILGHTISSDQTEWSLRGGPEGRFVTHRLPAGRVFFRFASPGKVRTFLERGSEPGVDKLDMGDVILVDEVPIRGVVVDQEGKPAPGVEVCADYDHEGSTKTDAAGRFAVHGAGKDAKKLTLRSNSYFAPTPFDLGPKRDDLKLVVAKAYEIHGSTVDAETGKPVRIDTVRLCIVDREPDGKFTLRG